MSVNLPNPSEIFVAARKDFANLGELRQQIQRESATAAIKVETYVEILRFDF